MERTLVIIKPDAMRAGHAEAIKCMIRESGLEITPWSAVMKLDLPLVERHYGAHKDLPFYQDLCSFMTSGPVEVCIVEGEDAVRRMSDLAGATEPKDWAEGTIRKRFGTSIGRNAVHSSDTPESAEREIAIFFRSPDSIG